MCATVLALSQREQSVGVNVMKKPQVGDWCEAYFGDSIELLRVVEWRGNRCYFSNCWYLVRGGESVGFY